MGKIPVMKVPFLWDLSRVRRDWGLSMPGFAAKMQKSGVTGVLIKLVEGRILYNQNDPALLRGFFEAMAAAGIEVHGWSYNYGDTNSERKAYGQAAKEVELSKRMVETYNLKSWTVNAESAFKSPDNQVTQWRGEARDLMARYNNELGVPIGFSSYKFPSSHNFPWREFIEASDFLIPQVYWQGNNDPMAGVTELNKSILQYKARGGENIPFVPAGTIYKESNYPFWGRTWWATPDQVTNFMYAVKDHPDCVGVSAWEICEAAPKPELWEAFAAAAAPRKLPTPPQPIPPDDTYQKLLTRLEACEARTNLVLELTDQLVADVQAALNKYKRVDC